MGMRSDKLKALQDEMQRPTPPRSMPLTRATETPPKRKAAKGGLVRSLDALGMVFLALALLNLVLGIMCICLSLLTDRPMLGEIAIGAFAAVFPLILAAVVFLWMSETLYRLRRIDERG